MAPSPENDSAPKAPDKSGDKTRNNDGQENVQKESSGATDGDSKDASVSRLDDRELKALLDEAINYKSPKDRQGKSRLFNNLLTEAEDDLRNARATSASGPQLARYYNQSASKRHRNRRQASSVSENLTHGGSLNNLAKEELYEAAIHLQKPKKTVSARQREGGSLPCNVNVGASYDRQFFEEARKKEKEKSKIVFPMAINTERTLDYDLPMSNDSDNDYGRLTDKYLKNTKIHEPCVNTSTCTIPTLEKAPKMIDNDYPKGIGYEPFAKLNAPFPVFSCRRDDKKGVDENCNALGMGLNQKKKPKKKPMEKNVNEYISSAISGHRGDIINDVDKLIDFIDGNDNVYAGQKLKSGVQKSQKIHKHIFDEGKNNRKQRTRSKGKGNNLQKSSSLEEMSTTTMEDFEFLQEDGKVALRQTKSNTDKPRERRSWGNSEQIQVQSLYNVSVENLEAADFRVVTKKKKSKKRRSSLSSRRQTYSREENVGDFNRVPSPEPRRKSAISVPHSEKSNDSSDVDSVHSLPVDANRINIDREDEDSMNFPISYADIAKNTTNQIDRPKWNNNTNISNNINNNNPIISRPNGENKKKYQDKKIPTSPDSDGSKTDVFMDKLPKKKCSDDKIKVPKQVVVNNTPQTQQITPKTQDKSTCVPEEKPAANVVTPIITTIAPTPIVKTQSSEMNLVNYMANFPSIPSKEKIPTSHNDNQQIQQQQQQQQQQQPKVVRNVIAEIQNWPAIPNNNNFNNGRGYDKNNSNKINNNLQNQQKSQRNLTNHFKNAKNVAVLHRHDKQQQANAANNINIAKAQNILFANDVQVIQNQERPMNVFYPHQNMPPNIQDVRTLEKHFKNPSKPIFFHNQFFCQLQRYPNDDNPAQIQQLPSPQQLQQPPAPAPVKEVTSPTFNYADDTSTNSSSNNSAQCEVEFASTNNIGNNGGSGVGGGVGSDKACSGANAYVGNTDCDRTTNNNNNNNNRPAVVILSGNGDKEVSGITFGFDINEQLLSDDVCSDFLARFVQPTDCEVTNGFNLDKIVNFIGVAWEDIIRETNGSVKYYTEEL